LCREVDQLRRQSVAELEAIGNQILDLGTEGAQRAHANRAGGRAVGIVIGDDEQALFRGDRVGEERRAVLEVLQQPRRMQPAWLVAQLAGRGDAPRGIEAREQGMDPALTSAWRSFSA
jgi:hypothetical protein